MGDLKEIAENYELKMCSNKDFIYKLDNLNTLKVVFKKENLPHMLGLHKLVDIEVLLKLKMKKISASKIYKDIINENITYNKISESQHFDKIDNRIKYFNEVEKLVFEKVIVDFDKTKLEKTSLKSDTLLYTKKDGFELILCLINTGKGYYSPETFIVHENDYYTKGQDKVRINKIIVKKKDEILKEVIHNKCNEEKTSDEVAFDKI